MIPRIVQFLDTGLVNGIFEVDSGSYQRHHNVL